MIDIKDYKKSLSNFATGVVIAMCRSGERDIGITISSFCSLSLDPPLLLFCINKKTWKNEIFTNCSRFSINVLSDSQKDISNHYAYGDDSGIVESVDLLHEVPVIKNAISNMICEIYNIVDGGDHHIVIGKVVEYKYSLDQGPLIYFRSGYNSL